MRAARGWWIALACVAACGGDGHGGRQNTSTIPAGAFDAKVTALCQKIVGCCTAAEITNLYGQVVDQAACEAMERVQQNQGIPIVQPDLAAGLRVYRADKEQTCVDKLIAQSCAEWAGDVSLARIPECFQILEGTIADGQPCTQGLYCVGGRCDNGSGSGVCAQLPAAGEACASVALCAPGLMCQFADGGSPTTCAVPPPFDPPMCGGV